jgi:hypothetical protein
MCEFGPAQVTTAQHFVRFCDERARIFPMKTERHANAWCKKRTTEKNLEPGEDNGIPALRSRRSTGPVGGRCLARLMAFASGAGNRSRGTSAVDEVSRFAPDSPTCGPDTMAFRATS